MTAKRATRGPWLYDRKATVLRHVHVPSFEVALEAPTPAQALMLIVKLAGYPWVSLDDLRWLAYALTEACADQPKGVTP